MKTFRFLAAILLATLAFHAGAQFRMATIDIRVGAHPLRVEVARSDPDRERGLMFRQSLGRNDGMLFVFDELAYQSMWMKNTMIPLSVAFLAGDGTILNILDMEPQTLDGHMSAGPARYAIETNKGWFAEHRVKVGDRVTGLPRVR